MPEKRYIWTLNQYRGASMASYDLLLNQTVIATAPPPQKEVVRPFGPTNPTTPPTQQSFQLVITGTAGNVSGTAQVIVSNDGVNWAHYGDPIVAVSTYLVAQASSVAQQSWIYYGAYLTAISGTGAKASLKMAA